MRLPDAVVGRIFEPAWDVYERSTRLRELRRLRRTQWEKPEAVRARQEAALRAMVTHAASTCAFYRDSFAQAGVDPASVRTLDDLAHLLSTEMGHLARLVERQPKREARLRP